MHLLQLNRKLYVLILYILHPRVQKVLCIVLKVKNVVIKLKNKKKQQVGSVYKKYMRNYNPINNFNGDIYNKYNNRLVGGKVFRENQLYNYIVNPNTGKVLNIKSKAGINLLLKYI
jgi:hypothetical protein